ncbi:MAG: hypothetical protein Q7S21_03775 [archaeon]|nr:hypothetical protein [archaeon]
MKLPKLREGPWRIVFEGKILEHDVIIYSNPEDTLMVLVLDKEKEKIKGAVIELFKILVSKGALEEFIETLPKEAITMIKHSANETIKYLVLSSPASYAKMDEEAFPNEVDSLLQKIHSSTDTVREVAKAYDLNLQELSRADEETKSAFFSNPIMFFGLATSNSVQGQKEGYAPIKIIKGDIILGLTKDNLIARESLSLFAKTAIFDGTIEERKHAMHLIIEGVLLSNIPAVIIDSSNSFDGLNVPSKNLTGLQQFKVDFEPIGFPIKDFTPMTDVKVDLNLVSPQGLLQLFGAGEGKSSQIIIDLMKKESFQNIQQIIDRLNEVEDSGDTTKYDVFKAGRILKLIDSVYPNFFNSRNDIAEISKNWVKAIGRAGIINLESLDQRQALLLTHNLFKGILEHYKKIGETSNISSMIFLTDAEKFFGQQEKNIISAEILQIMNEFNSYGIGYVFESQTANKLAIEASRNADTQLYVVEKTEIGLKLSNKKQYRVKTRPGLSECMETTSQIPAKKK